MKAALCTYEFKNGNISFNLSRIESALQDASGKADMVCFSESFLQGFDALSWDFEKDRHIAIDKRSETMRRIEAMSLKYGIDLAFGYFELDAESIYSSCAVIVDGRLTHNYRRISPGWRISDTDAHYLEGDSICEFDYRGQKLMLALCGDMWDMPERFKTDGVLLWPIYVNFSLKEWLEYEHEYAEQAMLAANKALLINSVSHDPESIGGAFCFENGRTAQKLEFGEEGLLFVKL